MGENTKLMSIVFTIDDPLITREYPSDIVKFQSFTTVQTNTSLWTPASGKSIFLTAIQASAAVPIAIQLNRAGNAPFFSIILTSTQATSSASFPSPIQLEPDEGITVTTNAAGTVNITLIGYELEI